MSAKEGKFRLGDLMAVPMQRILKYHLLLRKAFKLQDVVLILDETVFQSLLILDIIVKFEVI